ncbi:SagB family peptide dehydrogenase [Brevibacillus humidisoli]|uniref:SagB family peptide dehydrogenase n=1 Tax=Brevibacillus humidisoli TaxID=2895522 RepID=UPI001E2D41E6|nr:SagB family peptide dehydrogenase [Brevibacillus humidisoli]UFJ41730.1 SagB family peptide dehydrogenase [Brevibacillus humidisoli]
MRRDVFLHNLLYDIEKIIPADWEADWEDSPLPYKIYRNLPVVPLSLEVPLSLKLDTQKHPSKPNIRDLGHFLWFSFGLARLSDEGYSWNAFGQRSEELYRRFVPSGGGLYPNELYVYVNIDEVPAGVYHYDVAHHHLALLRKGTFDSYLTRVIGNTCTISECFAVAFVSTMFWKNFFKYHNLSYRLQGLDSGVLIGQLLEAAKRFGFTTGVSYQFLDRAVNHLLGLSEWEESVYAMVFLSIKPNANWFADRRGKISTVLDKQLYRKLPVVQHPYNIRSRRIRHYPMLIKLNEGSRLESTDHFQKLRGVKKPAYYEGHSTALPDVKPMQWDFMEACRKRFSPGEHFVLREVSQQQLATLLYEATNAFFYRNDLDRMDSRKVQQKVEPRVALYCCLHHVEGIPSGAYYYDFPSHTLRLIRLGDHRLVLKEAMTIDNINMLEVPICIHVVGDRDYLRHKLGYRGYRIQQMEAGILVQNLLLVAASIGLAGHPLLGYDTRICDKIYNIASAKKSCLIQVPIGPYRPPNALKGYLYV